MKKQKILIVHNYYQIPGGEDTVAANEKKMLEEAGHQVFTYYRSNSELKTMGIMRKVWLPFTTIFNIRTYREVKKMIKKNNIGIVHVHNTLNLISPSVYYAAFHCKVPVVQTIHNFRLLCPAATFYRDGKICEECVSKGLKCAVKHSCYRGSRLQTLACVISTLVHRRLKTYRRLNYICLTEFNKNKLLMLNRPGKKPVIRPERVFVKPNFVFKNPESRKPEDYYLFVGRIEEIKGISLLLDAFEKIPDKKLIIVGSGIAYEKYTADSKLRGIDNVMFVGYKNRDEINHLMAKAKAILVPSQWYETFGMIIAEGFASGTPVISGDIGNIGNLVTDGITGMKFKYDSADALVDVLQKFESADHEAWEENTLNEFKMKYSPEVNLLQIENIYEKMIKNKLKEKR